MLDRDYDGIRILHIDDDPDFLELSKELLEANHDDLKVVTETDAADGFERIETEAIDCVVCDYNLPSMNGIELLKNVRKDYPVLPYILYTGRGSEEVASDAISAGVTDYLQKDVGADQYMVLANRIRNAVSQARAEQEIEETRDFYQKILDYSSDFVIIVDPSGVIDYVSPAVERVMGYPPEELIGTNSFEFPHPDDRDRAYAALEKVLENPREEHTVEYRAQHNNGSWRWIEVRGQSLLDDETINGIMVNVRDITARKEREQALERQKERLEDFTSFLEHDVRNQLNIISGRVELIRDEIDSHHFESIRQAITRIQEMFETVMELAAGGEEATDLKPVRVTNLIETCWPPQVDATLDIELPADLRFRANPGRLQSLLENLFRNAIDHGGSEVTVTVGELDDAAGFFVEDNGTGIPPENRDRIFDSDFTTSGSETGLGLTIVNQIVEAHDWTITVTESDEGGARFEISEVQLVEPEQRAS